MRRLLLWAAQPVWHLDECLIVRMVRSSGGSLASSLVPMAPSCNNPSLVIGSFHFILQTGTDALVDAKKLQKNTRKWMCCGIIILLIVALVIVLAVVQ